MSFNQQTGATWGGRPVESTTARVTRAELGVNAEAVDSERYQIPGGDEELFYLVRVRLDERVIQTADRRMAEPVVVGLYAAPDGSRAIERDYPATRDRDRPVTEPDAWEVVEWETLHHAIAADPSAAGPVPDDERGEFRSVLRECHALPTGEVVEA